jgi:hypothetical protein
MAKVIVEKDAIRQLIKQTLDAKKTGETKQPVVVPEPAPKQPTPVVPSSISQTQVAHEQPPIDDENYVPNDGKELGFAVTSLVKGVPNERIQDFYLELKDLVTSYISSMPDESKLESYMRKAVRKIILEQSEIEDFLVKRAIEQGADESLPRAELIKLGRKASTVATPAPAEEKPELDPESVKSAILDTIYTEFDLGTHHDRGGSKKIYRKITQMFPGNWQSLITIDDVKNKLSEVGFDGQVSDAQLLKILGQESKTRTYRKGELSLKDISDVMEQQTGKRPSVSGLHRIINQALGKVAAGGQSEIAEMIPKYKEKFQQFSEKYDSLLSQHISNLVTSGFNREDLDYIVGSRDANEMKIADELISSALAYSKQAGLAVKENDINVLKGVILDKDFIASGMIDESELVDNSPGIENSPGFKNAIDAAGLHKGMPSVPDEVLVQMGLKKRRKPKA